MLFKLFLLVFGGAAFTLFLSRFLRIDAQKFREFMVQYKVQILIVLGLIGVLAYMFN